MHEPPKSESDLQKKKKIEKFAICMMEMAFNEVFESATFDANIIQFFFFPISRSVLSHQQQNAPLIGTKSLSFATKQSDLHVKMPVSQRPQ